jgi:hypothetical protein
MANKRIRTSLFIAQLGELFSKSRSKLITDDEIPKAKRLHSEHQRLTKYFESTTFAVMEKNWHEQREKATQAIAKGEEPPVDGLLSWPELCQRYAESNRNATEAINLFCRDQVNPFLVPIVLRCADAADDAADKKSKRDRTEAKELGLPHEDDEFDGPMGFRESETVIALRDRARHLRCLADGLKCNPNSQGSPLSILKECGLDLS